MSEDGIVVPPVVPPTVPPVVPDPAPKLFAGKYKTAEDLEKGYLEAQKLIGKPKSDLPVIDPATSPLSDDNFGVDAALAKMEMTEADVAKAITDNKGVVPAELYAKARAIGIPKKMFDDVVAQRATLAASAIATAVKAGQDVAGGAQQLDALYAFGKQLPPATIEAVNVMLANTKTHAEGVRLLKAHYDAAVRGGSQRPLLDGQGGSGEGPAGGYTTKTDFMRGANEARTSSEAQRKHIARMAASKSIDSLPMK